MAGAPSERRTSRTGPETKGNGQEGQRQRPMTADDIPCSNLGPLKRPRPPDGRLDRNGSSQCDCSPARSRRKKFVCQIAIGSNEGGFLYDTLMLFERTLDPVHVITVSIRHPSKDFIGAGAACRRNMSGMQVTTSPPMRSDERAGRELLPQAGVALQKLTGPRSVGGRERCRSKSW
jgi:hypothetical protein